MRARTDLDTVFGRILQGRFWIPYSGSDSGFTAMITLPFVIIAVKPESQPESGSQNRTCKSVPKPASDLDAAPPNARSMEDPAVVVLASGAPQFRRLRPRQEQPFLAFAFTPECFSNLSNPASPVSYTCLAH